MRRSVKVDVLVLFLILEEKASVFVVEYNVTYGFSHRAFAALR